MLGGRVGVKGTSSLPKVGLLLTLDVRAQPEQLVWRETPWTWQQRDHTGGGGGGGMLYGTKINVSHLSEWSGAVRETGQSNIPSYSASGPVQWGDWGQFLLSVVALEIMNKIMRIICYCHYSLASHLLPPCQHSPLQTNITVSLSIINTLSLSVFQYKQYHPAHHLLALVDI